MQQAAPIFPPCLQIRKVCGAFPAVQAYSLARARGALLLGRHFGDVRRDVLLNQFLDAARERAIRVVTRAVDRGVRAGVLEVEPTLRLELLGGQAVVSPALTELKEPFDRSADGDHEADDPGSDLRSVSRPAVQ